MNQQYQQQYCSMPLGTDQQQQYRSMPLGTGQQPFYPQEQQYSPQGMTFLPSYSPAASSQTPYTGETLAQNPLRRPFPTQSSVQTEAPYGSPNATKQPQTGTENGDGRSYFDYSYVGTVARIALYDDLRSAPRITEVQPSTTAEYIESLASKIYEQAKMAGGSIPYTVIREVSENFIHAQFAEIIVSILDEGNTIRFADQGPGISQKEKAQLPGFTSAIEPMKRFIRGVGSGLPIVKEYLDLSHGTISIEDNLGTGAVVTVSLRENPTGQSMSGGKGRGTKPSRGEPPQALVPPLSQRERDFLPLFLSEGALGVTDLVNLTGAPNSSAHSALAKLEESGLIEKTVGKKRILTDLGYQIATSL